jgi:hypothetical protein
MRYLLDGTYPGYRQRWIVEIAGGRQIGFCSLGTSPLDQPLPPCPADWATRDLNPSTSKAAYLDPDPFYRLEPLPLSTPRLLSPLDFRDPPYYTEED